MNTHTVLTPANIEIEYRLAGAGSRLAAFVVDFAVQIIMCLLLGMIILYGFHGYGFNALGNVGNRTFAILIISWFVIYFCYFIVCEMITNGQSIGKKLFGLRVIKDNGEPIELSQSLIRNLFRAVLDIIYVGLFFIIISPKHKRIGDIVAGTVVICEHYESVPLLPQNTASTAIVEQMRHLTLTDDERNLLNLYQARKIYLPEHAAGQLKHEWADYFSRKWQIDPELIDDELLAGLLQINEER